MSYSLSEDITYTFCSVGIWVVVELTCGLLVLCMPSIPRALKDLGVTQIYMTFKAWTKETLVRRSDGQSNDSPSVFGNAYKKQFDPQGWHELEARHDASSLEDGSRMDRELVSKPGQTDTSILRTTQIGITTEENQDFENHGRMASQQHPWAPEP